MNIVNKSTAYELGRSAETLRLRAKTLHGQYPVDAIVTAHICMMEAFAVALEGAASELCSDWQWTDYGPTFLVKRSES